MKLNFNFKSQENHFLTSGISHPVLWYNKTLQYEFKSLLGWARIAIYSYYKKFFALKLIWK